MPVLVLAWQVGRYGLISLKCNCCSASYGFLFSNLGSIRGLSRYKCGWYLESSTKSNTKGIFMWNVVLDIKVCMKASPAFSKTVFSLILDGRETGLSLCELFGTCLASVLLVLKPIISLLVQESSLCCPKHEGRGIGFYHCDFCSRAFLFIF